MTAQPRAALGGPRWFWRLAAHQMRYDLRALVRNRQSQFFTLVLPVLFLVIFASVFGGRGKAVQVAGGAIGASVSYVPGIMALGIIAPAFIDLVISVTARRETGVLKRRRATPAPAGVIIIGRAITAVVTALAVAAVVRVALCGSTRSASPTWSFRWLSAASPATS